MDLLLTLVECRLYGAETETLRRIEEKRLKAYFEICILSRIELVNEQTKYEMKLLERVGEEAKKLEFDSPYLSQEPKPGEQRARKVSVPDNIGRSFKGITFNWKSSFLPGMLNHVSEYGDTKLIMDASTLGFSSLFSYRFAGFTQSRRVGIYYDLACSHDHPVPRRGLRHPG
ncbi:hypothetical protein ANN_22301 [Periplaneta americana]|uniref:Uncharacterized protein n=1 Tax=Periplaneta americana TaxID=6978 RepID=A0ABQ8S7R1_PERAM|nr:hypothetical protein ANN_22301 [Periplaneta americana]